VRLGVQVAQRARRAHVGHRDLHAHVRVPGRVEGQPAPGHHPRALLIGLGAPLDIEGLFAGVLVSVLAHSGTARRPGHLGRAGTAPGPGGAERPVEPGREVDRVAVGLAAEVAAGHRPGHLPVPDRLEGRGRPPVGAVGHLEQQLGRAGGRVAEPGHPGPVGHGQLGPDPARGDRVGAGVRALGAVAE
jgi:hypothetical protein